MSTSTHAIGRDGGFRKLRTRSGRLSKGILAEIVQALRAGGVAVFPTETVYGLGTSAFSAAGIRWIYDLKGRHWKKPLALLVPTLAAAGPLVETIPEEAFRLADAFWPGPLTLILKASPLGKLVTGGRGTIGVRVPRHPVTSAILKALGVPLATTSANPSGKPPATSGTAAARIFTAKVSWLIDGGACAVKTASSVIDLSSYPFTVIREGAIKKHRLQKALIKPSV